MTGPVQLSVILTTHTKKQDIDALLLHLLRFRRDELELIIINDAADPETGEDIHKTLQKNPNDQAYLFEHERAKGRGFCLNEALTQAEGSLIWAPLKAERLNENLMHDAIRRFKSDPAAFWALDYDFPGTQEEWIRRAMDGELPDDSCLIWNRSVIRPNHFFFNPFMTQLHGAELALRLSEFEQYSWHTTDPFFVVAEHQSPLAGEEDRRELIHSLLRIESDPEVRLSLLSEIQDAGRSASENPQSLIDMARTHLDRGDAKKALDHISRFLKHHPGHTEASRLKVISLERLRRHVEAAELKHQLKKQERAVRLHGEEITGDGVRDQSDPVITAPEEVADQSTEIVSAETEKTPSEKPELSIVIPTTGTGRPLLEAVLVELETVVDEEKTELIVVDNASIDDTFDYLEKLREKNFMNLRVVTNNTNKGFAASVNQGIKAATTGYVLVMHNDLYLEEGAPQALLDVLEQNSDVVIAAPLLDRTDNPSQKIVDGEDADLIEMNRADSACFMIRKNSGFEFDEEYRLCHFEMDDFCRQIRTEGRVIAAVPAATATHRQNETTGMMGLRQTPELKWQNRDYFVRKWTEPVSWEMPLQGNPPDRFNKLGAPENPADPPREWVAVVQNYLTDEVRTEILRSDWTENQMMTIVSTLLIADERELLRTLEDRINSYELDPSLLLLFVNFYFSKNIYSRCRHYLKKAGDSHPAFDLYRLKIMVADKEIDRAAPLLTKLLKKFPASPDLFRVAGDLYKVTGDGDEAKSFYALANQLDPFRFKAEDAAFEIKL